MIRNKSAVLRRCSAFQHALPASIRTLAAASSPRRLARRSPLWGRGDQGHPVVVRSGVLREAVGNDVRSLTLGFWGRGAILGVETLSGAGMVADVEVYVDSIVLEIPGDALRTHALQDAGLAMGLMDGEADRRCFLQQRMENLVVCTAIQRLAAEVIELGHRFGVRDSRGTIVNLRVTHKELAALIGATRETVSFAVSDLRHAGLIENDGKRVVILDPHGLQQVADGG